MPIELESVQGWRVEIHEISAGVYRARGTNRDGRSVEMTGTDPEDLSEKCRQQLVRLLTARCADSVSRDGMRIPADGR